MPLNNTILYVEDNFENRVLIRRILQAEGYIVLEAENATEAMAAVREGMPDLILMDINMPDVDGYSLTATLKSIPKLRGVPVIALTANVMKGDRERSFQAGCDGYIQKPVDVDQFPSQIALYLQR
jgi:two-component system cell cycle response regulator DivK